MSCRNSGMSEDGEKTWCTRESCRDNETICRRGATSKQLALRSSCFDDSECYLVMVTRQDFAKDMAGYSAAV